MSSIFQVPANLFQLSAANMINLFFEVLRLPIAIITGS